MSDTQDNSVPSHKIMYPFLIGREISNFYEYLNILDEELNLRNQELSTSIESNNKSVNLKVEAEQVKEFSNLMRQSFLISLYSFMELWLVRECYIDSKNRDGGKSYKSIEKKGLEKAKKYFSSVIKNNYPFDSSQDWLWIKKFQRLRNCIIHRQGSLNGFSDFEVDTILEKFVKNENGLYLYGINNNQIFIKYEFCLKTLKIVHKFTLELLGP